MKHWGEVDAVNYNWEWDLTNSCTDPNDGCYCDINDKNWRGESGLLTDKLKLPVRQLRLGDTGEGDIGHHTLGKMKFRPKSTVVCIEFGSSSGDCENLKFFCICDTFCL